MKSYLISIFLGVAASAMAGGVLAFGSSVAAGALNHSFEAWPWLFLVSVIPCAVLPPLGLWLSFRISFRGGQFFCAFLLAFSVVALSGSAGAIAVESAKHNFATVNVTGYLAWCWVYAVALLPISYPLAAQVLYWSKRTRTP